MGFFYLKSVGLVSAAQAIAGFFALCYTLVIARTLGVHEYGFFQAVMGLYGALTFFSMPLFLACIHCVGSSEPAKRPAVVGEFLKLAMCITMPLFLLLAVFSPYLKGVFEAASLYPFMGLGLLVMATALLRVFHGALQGEHEYSRFAFARVGESLLILLLGGMFLFSGSGSTGALLGYAAGMSAVIIYFLTQKHTYKVSESWTEIGRQWPVMKKILWIFAVFLAIDNIPMIYGRLSLSSEDSGFYGVLFNLRLTMWPFAVAITFPFYAQLVTGKSEKGLLKKGIVLIGALIAGYMAVAFFFPEGFLNLLYGKEFIGASSYMVRYGAVLFLLMLNLILMFYLLAGNALAVRTMLLSLIVLAAGCYVSGSRIEGLMNAQMIACVCNLMVMLGGYLYSRRSVS